MKKLLFLCFALPLLIQAQISVAPGSKFPGVRVEWIKRPSAKVNGTAEKPSIEVVTMIDITMRDAVQTLRLVEELEKKYRYSAKGTVRFRTIARNSPEELKKTLSLLSVPCRTAIGSDKKDYSFNNFAIATVPYTFIGKNDAIAWSGHPVDIEFVIDSLLEGKFDSENFREVIKLRREMQTALRSGLPDVAAAAAERALRIAPNDTIALQTRLYAFQVAGKYAEAVEFLEKHLKGSGRVIRSRVLLILLDLIARTGDMQKWSARAEKAFSELETPEEKLALLAYFATSSPYGYAPLKSMLTLSEQLLKQFKKGTDTNLSIETFLIAARISYAACRPADAVRYQESACKLMKKEQFGDTASAEELLKYYREAAALAEKKSL